MPANGAEGGVVTRIEVGFDQFLVEDSLKTKELRVMNSEMVTLEVLHQNRISNDEKESARRLIAGVDAKVGNVFRCFFLEDAKEIKGSVQTMMPAICVNIWHCIASCYLYNGIFWSSSAIIPLGTLQAEPFSLELFS